MAIDAISVGMVGLSGFKAYQQYEAGKEAQAAYNRQAAEVGRQAAYQQRMALEQSKTLTREGRDQRSRAVAAAGKSGLRVAGSVSTLTEAINAGIEHKKALVAMESNEQGRQAAFQIRQYRHAGRAAKKAAGIEAVGSLLTGGLMLAQRKEQTGKSWGKLFYDKKPSARRTTDAYKYYRTSGYGSY